MRVDPCLFCSTNRPNILLGSYLAISIYSLFPGSFFEGEQVVQRGQVFHHIMLTLLGKKMCRKSRPAIEPEQSGKVLWGAILLDGDQIIFNCNLNIRL